jgi:ribosomal protein RSM22 (predicted rRNA methylase)
MLTGKMTDASPSPIVRIERHIIAEILSPAAQAQYASGDVSHAELRRYAPEIAALSRAYTEHAVGKALAGPIKGSLAAEAYALYYTPINAAKIIHLLPQLSLPRENLRLLDFGSGPGTAALAFLAGMECSLDVHCVETSAAMRLTAQKLLGSWRGASSVARLSATASLRDTGEGQFDVIVAANSLAELGEKQAELMLSELTARLAPDGVLMLLEPGQQAHTRRLMRIRDSLAQSLTPIYPCTTAGPCPMLASSESDWCHTSLTWQQPPLSRQLDALLGFNKHRIKFSAFIFQRGAVLREGVRIVVAPEKTPRGIAVTVCGPSGEYGPVLIRKGERSQGTKALERAAVFDRLILTGDGEYLKAQP